MSAKLETLSQNLQRHFGDKLKSLTLALGELTVEVGPADYIAVMTSLRDEADFGFEEIIDLCGVDYSTYGDGAWNGQRFAVVVHLLPVSQNTRLRRRVVAYDKFHSGGNVATVGAALRALGWPTP